MFRRNPNDQVPIDLHGFVECNCADCTFSLYDLSKCCKSDVHLYTVLTVVALIVET